MCKIVLVVRPYRPPATYPGPKSSLDHLLHAKHILAREDDDWEPDESERATPGTTAKRIRELVSVLNRTRCEPITFRSGDERAAVAPALLDVSISLARAATPHSEQVSEAIKLGQITEYGRTEEYK
jgi:hypothetical protein